VRGLTGLLITASGDLSTARIVAAGIACWFAGVLFVTTRWAVESMPFARRHGDRLAWAADEQAKRGHLLALARWLPRDAAAAPHDLRRWRPMWTTAPVGAPWNLAALPALAAAWVLGVGPAHAVGSLHVVGSLVLVVACWLTLIGGPRLVRTSIACAVAATVASLTAGTVRAAIPAIVVCVLYAVCTHQRLVDVGASWQRLGRAIATALHRADGRRPAARGATPSPGYSTSARP
jgi:hypothetical protein